MAASALTMLLPWPLATGAKLLLAPARAADSPAPDFREEAVLASPTGQLSVVLGGATKAVFAAAVYALAPPDLAAAAALAPAWAARIAARDLAITWLIGGSWDWLHLSPHSPLFETLRPYRFAEPGAPYPTAARLGHDFFWASCGALVSTCWEVLLLHLWATGALPLASVPGDAWWRDALTVLALLAIPHFQIVHFYLTHRVMHRWPRCCTRRGVPDVGQFLYKHVHSLHHKAKDPSAFSGISMHPVESALFFTTMPIACLLGLHPIVMLHAKFYNISAAMLGHESFGGPSTGGHSHWLHHKLVDCNFGGSHIPLDWLCGSHVRDEAEFERRFVKAAPAPAPAASAKSE